MGILSAMLWAPAMGALLLTLVPGRDANVSRNLGNLFAAITFLLACYLLFSFDQHDAGLQFSEYFSINPKVGSAYALGVDGLSMPMVALATLLTSIALLASPSITNGVKGYYISIRDAELVSDLKGLFSIFSENTLIQMYFLLDRWGGKPAKLAN